jgi:glucose-1-phosphate adenylyltransferase
MKKHKTVAMLLAGGQGSRLQQLTHNLAKPAMPFGGKYRLIDFTLSNCRYSNIDVVGVLTQYKPMLLNSYIGSGAAWGLNSILGGVSILPPYMGSDGGSWYKGTADAIRQNIEFIDQYNPEYVLVLSGDHIYKMDYSKMIKEHQRKNAALTIAVQPVPLEETSRFGILVTNSQGVVTEFQEKPEKSTSNLASMGVYVFNWPLLRKALIEDSKNKTSAHDFGKSIVPKLLADNQSILAYEFTGYWKDVGTIDSYYEASMELLNDIAPIDIYDHDFPVYSNSKHAAPHFIGSNAIIKGSLVCDACTVHGTVKQSILSSHCNVKKRAIVKNSILLPNVTIDEDVIIRNAIVAEGMHVTKNIQNYLPTTEKIHIIHDQLSDMRKVSTNG